MAAINIPAGSRLSIAYAPEPGGNPDFTLNASFFKALDESAFLLSVPLKNGQAVQVDENQKLLLKYTIGSEVMIISAYCDDVVKQGVRKYWKMRRVAEQHQFFKRADERYKVALHVGYKLPTWAPKADGTIPVEDAMTLDISAGGAALFLSTRFDVGEVIQMELPRIGSSAEGEKISDVVAAICWYRDAPKGSPYRFICGVQFRFADDVERNRMHQYIANVKDVYKL